MRLSFHSFVTTYDTATEKDGSTVIIRYVLFPKVGYKVLHRFASKSITTYYVYPHSRIFIMVVYLTWNKSENGYSEMLYSISGAFQYT